MGGTKLSRVAKAVERRLFGHPNDYTIQTDSVEQLLTQETTTPTLQVWRRSCKKKKKRPSGLSDPRLRWRNLALDSLVMLRPKNQTNVDRLITLGSNPSTDACHRALGIAELLENIILHLPVDNVILIQRVSKTWQATISKSPKLQKALFFQPSVKLFVADDYTLLFFNSERMPAGSHSRGSISPFPGRPTQRSAIEVYVDSILGTEALCNPFLYNLCKPKLNGLPYRTNLVPNAYMRASDFSASESRIWRRMYITQPPVACIKVSSSPRYDGDYPRFNPNRWCTSIFCPSGVTLGDYVQLQRRNLKECRGGQRTRIRCRKVGSYYAGMSE